MSYFNKNKNNKQSSQQQQQSQQEKPQNKQFQQKQPVQEEKMLGFAQEEVVFIENVLVKLQEMIPNEQGENSEILEMIVTAIQIVSARLDNNQAGMIGDSG